MEAKCLNCKHVAIVNDIDSLLSNGHPYLCTYKNLHLREAGGLCDDWEERDLIEENIMNKNW